MIRRIGKDPDYTMVLIGNSLIKAALLVVLMTGTAHAYVDPGTGSYLLQILIAGILGAAFALKLYWTRIKSFLSGSLSGRKRRKDDRPGSDNERD
ncbi:MAG: hypothetical protein KAX13_12340 [Candidatus Krumholzibacteria bacterium]|nr:hypothetical protein [Candidatus Krumholzibacteria bacterium]